ncbi:MAG: hypothetical protein QOJ04_4282 [Caballeronia sp.]|jgi:hypothetical protein|nr:hypothetical protein [Caballeronia sp.]
MATSEFFRQHLATFSHDILNNLRLSMMHRNENPLSNHVGFNKFAGECHAVRQS